jgi:hypothetical protein
MRSVEASTDLVEMRQAPQAIDLISETFALTGGEARMLLAAGRGEALLLAGSHRVAFQTVASARGERAGTRLLRRSYSVLPSTGSRHYYVLVLNVTG